MTDPSYGGKFWYVDNKWRLDVLIDFNEASMPTDKVVLDKISYQIYEVPTSPPAPLVSPDRKMTLVPKDGVFKAEMYLVIVEGYNGWPNPTGAVFQQYFIQAGQKNDHTLPPSLEEFSLRFDGLADGLSSANLELCHVSGQNPGQLPTDVGFVTDDPSGHAIVVGGLTALGYYGLMHRPDAQA